jgi:hypothetical protein
MSHLGEALVRPTNAATIQSQVGTRDKRDFIGWVIIEGKRGRTGRRRATHSARHGFGGSSRQRLTVVGEIVGAGAYVREEKCSIPWNYVASLTVGAIPHPCMLN